MKLSKLFVLSFLLLLTPALLFARQGDPNILKKMDAINKKLQAKQIKGTQLKLAVEAIDVFSIGVGRPSNRIHQQTFQWAAFDPNRLAQGDDITYIVDQSAGATASGLTNAQTEAAIDSALSTWDVQKPFRNVDIVKRADPGTDITIFDFFFGFGGFGNPFAADIVNAGWFPLAYFNAVTGGAGCGVLAFSVTFIFTDGSGNPFDGNHDGYADTALNEVYYNTDFGDPASPCTAGTPNSTQPWGINQALPGIDVETVALHENGHSLSIGHFGPPPIASLNPVYQGILQSPLAADLAGMKIVWSNWPD